MTSTQSTPTYWKTDIEDLLALASDVAIAPKVRARSMSASEAAHALVGVVSFVTAKYGKDRMQRACADLARQKDWKLITTSSNENALIACVVHGLRELAGETNVRAALSFWAVENDPCVWQMLLSA